MVMAREPGYWMYETTGLLRPVIEDLVHGKPLSPPQIELMRQYLHQWVYADGFFGPEVDQLRLSVLAITTRADIDRWIAQAIKVGIDPL